MLEEGHSEPIVILARDEGETVWERWFTLEEAERLAAKLSRVIAEYRQKLQTGTLIKRKKAKPRKGNPRRINRRQPASSLDFPRVATSARAKCGVAENVEDAA
jgi:hypothetical protein